MYFISMDEIYFSKTKEYFREVLSSYANGNYRSAIVMLYSVAICDLLLKLQELKDMYNDTVAEEILEQINKSRNEGDKKSKSRWEKELVDSVYQKTKFLNYEAYMDLAHLYDYRNLSAHPALNENYELFAPSQETVIALIKNTLSDVLIKPPIFIKNVIDMLTEDIKEKKDTYQDDISGMKQYLNNKYFNRMSIPMRLKTIQTLWKFCFLRPENPECVENRVMNRRALEILIEENINDAMSYIQSNTQHFTTAEDGDCVFALIILLSKFPELYSMLNNDTRNQIDCIIKRNDDAKMMSWFKYKTLHAHSFYLLSQEMRSIDERVVHHFWEQYEKYGETREAIDVLLSNFGKSGSFDTANYRFRVYILPYLKEYSHDQAIELISCINNNDQIYQRRLNYEANGIIVKELQSIIGREFTYDQYPNFRFDKSLLEQKSSAENEELPIN